MRQLPEQLPDVPSRLHAPAKVPKRSAAILRQASFNISVIFTFLMQPTSAVHSKQLEVGSNAAAPFMLVVRLDSAMLLHANSKLQQDAV